MKPIPHPECPDCCGDPPPESKLTATFSGFGNLQVAEVNFGGKQYIPASDLLAATNAFALTLAEVRTALAQESAVAEKLRARIAGAIAAGDVGFLVDQAADAEEEE